VTSKRTKNWGDSPRLRRWSKWLTLRLRLRLRPIFPTRRVSRLGSVLGRFTQARHNDGVMGHETYGPHGGSSTRTSSTRTSSTQTSLSTTTSWSRIPVLSSRIESSRKRYVDCDRRQPVANIPLARLPSTYPRNSSRTRSRPATSSSSMPA